MEQISWRIRNIIGVVLNRKPFVMDPKEEINLFSGNAVFSFKPSCELWDSGAFKIIFPRVAEIAPICGRPPFPSLDNRILKNAF